MRVRKATLGSASAPPAPENALLSESATTTLEGILLFRGHAWGEWLVVAGLGALLPFEVRSLEKHPTWVRLAALVINAAVVVYLVVLRLRNRRAR